MNKLNGINIVTRDDMAVSLKSYMPESPGKHPAVILLTGLTEDKSHLQKFILTLVSNGYAVFLVYLRGHGRSKKTYDGHEIIHENMHERDWQKIPEDMYDVINFVAQEKHIDSSKIGLIGAGIGADIVTITGSKFSDIANTVIAISPAQSFHGFYLSNFAEKLNIPVLMAVSKDDASSFDASNQLNNVVKDTLNLIIYKGDKHGIELLIQSIELQNKILEWLDEYI